MERKLAGRFELRVLGPADLRDPQGREVAAVLVQPKRFALLCYLALASPRGLHRRDELIGLLWPERSDASARHALSQSLHFLRQRLGRDGVVSRGSEVGINPDRVCCDAVQFDEALAAGSLEEALGLYRGDLLDAFFVSEAPDVEQWLSAERARLRSCALDAALRLSMEASRRGDLDGAVRWGRWAVARAPEDEAAARRLAECLEAGGDRAAAIQVLDGYVRWLDQELSAGPAAATRAVLRSLHSHEGTTLSGQTRPRHGRPPPATPAAPADWLPERSARQATDVARPRTARVRARTGFTGAVAAVVLLAGAGTAYQRLGLPGPAWPERSVGAVDERTVAVLPFAFHGHEGTTHLSGAVAELLGRDLDGAAGFHTIDPRTTAGLAGAVVGQGPRRIARTVHTRAGAGTFITGSITETGGRIRLNATWYGAEGRRLATGSAEGRVVELFTVVDRLAAELLTGLHADHAGQMIRSAARNTGSLEALKLFILGEMQLRGGSFAAAAASFQRAVAVDTAFALAWYRLSVAAEYVGEARLAHDAAAAAVANGQRLDPVDRVLLDALLAARRGDAELAEYLFREVITVEPLNLEAWLQLAEVQFHYGPLAGRPARESKRAWQVVLELEPDNVSARYHLARILALEEDWSALSELTAATSAIAPGHERLAAMRALASMGAGDAAVERVAVQLQGADDASLYMAVFDAITYGGNPRGACRLARLLTQPTRPPDMRAWGHLWLAHLELASGRWQAAQHELGRLEELDPLAAIEYSAFLALHPLLEPGSVDVQRIRQGLQQARSVRPPLRSGDYPSAGHAELRPYLHPYLLALLEARWGDPSRLEPAAAVIEARAPAGSAAAFLPASLRAFGAALGGDPERAGEWLEQVLVGQWYEAGRWSAFLGHCQDRWLMAGNLERLGRRREALRWHEAAAQTSPMDVIFLAPAALRGARIHGRLGEADAAAADFARFVLLWRRADPELRTCLEAGPAAADGGRPDDPGVCADWTAR
jgi:DNA-binding SARP family transcriptional activator/tetratricopeptide (TPR) repeat protein